MARNKANKVAPAVAEPVAPAVAEPTPTPEATATTPPATMYAKRYAKLPNGDLSEWTVTVPAKTNPKRGKSQARFQAYNGNGNWTCTVKEALAGGVWRADLSWDLAHGLIALAPPKASKTAKA